MLLPRLMSASFALFPFALEGAPSDAGGVDPSLAEAFAELALAFALEAVADFFGSLAVLFFAERSGFFATSYLFLRTAALKTAAGPLEKSSE